MKLATLNIIARVFSKVVTLTIEHEINKSWSRAGLVDVKEEDNLYFSILVLLPFLSYPSDIRREISKIQMMKTWWWKKESQAEWVTWSGIFWDVKNRLLWNDLPGYDLEIRALKRIVERFCLLILLVTLEIKW
jgi:hypothetical protein